MASTKLTRTFGSGGNRDKWTWSGWIKRNKIGAEIFPGFAAAEILYNEDGSVKGVSTGDMGLDSDGKEKSSYEPGFEFHAKYTVFAEGCRGHLGKEIIDDKTTKPDTIQKVILCNGKIYYDLMAKKEKAHDKIAIVRLEQLYPFAEKQLADLKKRYKNASEWTWVQEEPENMLSLIHI